MDLQKEFEQAEHPVDVAAHGRVIGSSWVQLPAHQVAWRAFTDGNRRMFVMNANRTSVEQTVGVDIVYWNEHQASFVLVQYKKMRREDSTGQGRATLAYRPDHNLEAELERMARVDAMRAQQDGDFRLLATPCWLKLCEPAARVSDPASLIPGMYLAREHFEQLLKTCTGPRGGTRLSYENVNRHLNNTTFVDLVSDGWIGSRGAGSDAVRDLVQESIETGHAVVLGVRGETKPRDARAGIVWPDQADVFTD